MIIRNDNIYLFFLNFRLNKYVVLKTFVESVTREATCEVSHVFSMEKYFLSTDQSLSIARTYLQTPLRLPEFFLIDQWGLTCSSH